MQKIKLNIKYKWCSSSEPVFPIVNHFKRKHRKIKKYLKIALIDISNTLDIHDWNIEIEIRDSGIKDGIIQYYISIEVRSKNKNINGYLLFTDVPKLLSENHGQRPKSLNRFYYIHHENNFYNNLVTKKHTILLMLDNFSKENSENIIDFTLIYNKEITDFKNKHEGFLRYIHNNNIYTFNFNGSPFCGVQLFYVCEQIYWNSSYSFPFEEDVKFSNVRSIKENNNKTFLRSMIEAGVININQDIEEVLACDIKDIFAMSKLIGY